MSQALTTPPLPAGVALAVQKPLPKTHVAPLDHAMQLRAVQNDRMARGMAAMTATLRLAAKGVDAEAVDELLAMQQAVFKRLVVLYDGWAQGWAAWARYADQIKGANTMSKLVERESNIFAQAMQLVLRQATDLAALQENIEVDYAYWVSGK